ncbi:MAG: SIR2 family protein [Malacoplasma sp.]|nr:SIR2 family protein [Malacoplasma sp.]
MPNNEVFFLGAGFSVRANIPTQGQIWNEMLKDTPSFSSPSSLSVPESKKFLLAYIKVGIFLLDRFTNENITDIIANNSKAKYLEQLINILAQSKSDENEIVLTDLLTHTPEDGYERAFVSNLKDPCSHESLIKVIETHYYTELVKLKESIRKLLLTSNINVDLEDVFTIFDKSLREHENWRDITYLELDELRHALLRLFTYYFGKWINSYQKSRTTAYSNFVNYCDFNHASILTTNWDTVLEIAFRKTNKAFWTNLEDDKTALVKILKLHGSINWFKCNCCGEYQIAEYGKIADYLFDDSKIEKCEKCDITAKSSQVLLQPDIITPTMLKSLDSKLFREIWAQAATELEKANKITFIGYSLPQADFEIRYLLRKHIKKQTQIDVVLSKNDKPLSTTDVWNKPEIRYRNLFPGNNIIFYYKGFEDYFKNMK